MSNDILKLMIAQTEKELKTLFHKKTGKPQELLEEINRVLSQVIVPAKLLGTQTLDCDECASINVNQAFDNLQKVITWINEPIATVKSISIDSLPDFISDGDLCKFLNIEQTTLYTKRSRGELPVQNNYGFTLKDDLVQFLGIKKVKQTPLAMSKQRENNIDKYRKPR